MNDKLLENDEPLKLENQLCFPLYACSKELVKKYKPYLDVLGITYTQYITLMVLWEHKSLNVKTLGAYLYLNSGTITPVVKKLEAQGLLIRKRQINDERIVIITLTDLGWALKEKARSIPLAISKCLSMTPSELKQLHTLLYKALDSMC